MRLDAIFQTFVRISNGGVLLGRRALLDVGVHVTKERAHIGMDVTGVDGIFAEDAQFVFGGARPCRHRPKVGIEEKETSDDGDVTFETNIEWTRRGEQAKAVFDRVGQ